MSELKHPKSHRYIVTIETGPESDMGTDADAYIVLKSGEESSEELSLYHTGDEEEFKPGRQQEFEVEFRDIGDISSILVSKSGIFPVFWCVNRGYFQYFGE